uniref:Uncharacterized protein n=1 Tax=Panagrellus redivivus TaxID=6233 RepID=A0A7E4V3K6_PANRE
MPYPISDLSELKRPDLKGKLVASLAWCATKYSATPRRCPVTGCWPTSKVISACFASRGFLAMKLCDRTC